MCDRPPERALLERRIFQFVLFGRERRGKAGRTRAHDHDVPVLAAADGSAEGVVVGEDET